MLFSLFLFRLKTTDLRRVFPLIFFVCLTCGSVSLTTEEKNNTDTLGQIKWCETEIGHFDVRLFTWKSILL